MKEVYNEGFGTFYERLVRKEYLISLNINFDSVLEVKCGFGADSLIFKDKEVTLIENRSQYLQECKTLLAATSVNNNIELIKSDFLNLPFQSSSFDLVWSSNLIDEVPNPKAYILEMKRVSRKYVLLFASNDLHPTHSYSKFKKESGPWIDIRTLPRIFESCELEIIDRGNIDSPPWPSGINLPTKLKDKKRGKPDSRELDASGVLRTLVSFERHIILNFVKIFTGHQVFILAEKG